MFMYTPECTHIIYNSVVIYKSILRHLNLCELDFVDSWYHTTVQSNGATSIGGVSSEDSFILDA